MSEWCENVGFDFRRFISTESEQLIWKSEGLPSDDLSMENAMVILKVCNNNNNDDHDHDDDDDNDSNN